MTGMTESLLEDIVEPFAECLTEDAAKKIVALRAGPKLQGRLDELAEKANFGTLLEDEKAEYDRYLAAYHFVTVMQARARRFLKS